ncbi:hypothetical protein FSZ31_09180 [Sphingorhabdus soli]|uniref:Uncharacterized protein n=1 Tax=Flavisphingopyxis soli TaxID=2601267 RepID=A0A5C6U8J9_9SPHN|nr:hypothetical protein [Sphingorhabdus soli]TXC69094.1 hypothetical protein FSZ31_09180 [Sphingorhabdus soli]
MNAHQGSRASDGGPATPAMQALPASLARRGRTLIDAVESLIARPRRINLTERQGAETREIVRKLVDGIEIDLCHFLPRQLNEAPSAWDTIAARGLPVEGLARPVLARALERSLEDGRKDPEISMGLPDWANDDAGLADLWMRYGIADRRRRDSWHAPVIIAADLPVEAQAALTECVASALLSQQPDRAAQAESYVRACAESVSLYREETGIGVAAARLIDAALAVRPPSALIADLIACAAWPAIIALISRFSGTDQSDTTIFLCIATTDEIATWLSPSELDARVIEALRHAIESVGPPRGDGREDLSVGGLEDDHDAASPAERIVRLAERYRDPSR